MKIKINKKAKFKSLNKIITFVKNNKKTFLSIYPEGIDLELGYDNIYNIEPNAEILVKEYYYFENCEEDSFYVLKNENTGKTLDINCSNSEIFNLFSRFPKVTDGQIKKAIKGNNSKDVLLGIGGFELDFRKNGKLVVGCQEYDKEQVNEIFKFLAKNLNYNLEE